MERNDDISRDAACKSWEEGAQGKAPRPEVQTVQSKSAANALRESQLLYSSLVENMPAGIFRKDLAGRYTFANAHYSRSRGLAPDQILGKTIFDLVSRESAERYNQQDQTVLRTGKMLEAEEEEQENGQIKYKRVIRVPVFDSDGKITGIQGVIFDITRRKEMEAELSREHDLMSALMDHMPDAIYFKDLQSRFVRFSRSTAEQARNSAIHAYRAAHPSDPPGSLPDYLSDPEKFAQYLVGKTDFDMFTEERARSAFQDEQKIIQTGEPLVGNVKKTHETDGSVNWRLTTKMPWRNKEGKIIGTYGISKDITALKDAESKLDKVHKQLLQTSRMAGMAEVATGVLHNVGNVLNSINVSTTILADTLRKSKIKNVTRVSELFREHADDLPAFLTAEGKGKQVIVYLEKLAELLAKEQDVSLKEIGSIRGNVEHIREIVAMQQNYAKISGVAEKVKVSELVEDALRMNLVALTRHDVRIVRDYAPNAPEITVEKHKVLQILVNLIRNAKYACDDSGRQDKLLSLQVKECDRGICITVTDNGIGIPKENLTRIFSHGFTTRKDGHGFGLHSGALAAKEMGGTLAACSDGHQCGASFTLELPLTPPAMTGKG